MKVLYIPLLQHPTKPRALPQIYTMVGLHRLKYWLLFTLVTLSLIFYRMTTLAENQVSRFEQALLSSFDNELLDEHTRGVGDSLHLNPPSQEWIRRQYRHTVNYLGLKYSPPNQWNRCSNSFNTLFFPNINTIFTGVPKAGCSNWMAALMLAEGILKKPLDHDHLDEVHSVYAGPYRMQSVRRDKNRIVRPDFTFTGVRNPWTRIVSAYKDKLQPGSNQELAILRVLGYARHIPHAYSKTNNLYPTFEEFLKFIIDKKGSSNYHFKQQVHTLCLPYAEYDYIVPIEYSSVISSEIWKKINASVELPMSYDSSSDPRTQRSTIEAKSMFSKIDKDTIEKFYKLYKPDFMLMNYSNFTDPNFPLPIVY